MNSQLHRTFIIAEAGVNHNGDISLAKKLIEKAKEAGADAVKFQTFSAEKLALKDLKKADYQKRNEDIIESQYDMLKRLELSLESHHLLKEYCRTCDIDFMSSTFDNESTNFLVNDMGCNIIKVGSGELTNAPLLFHLARKQANIILSTGMSNLSEIEQALSTLAFGYLFQEDIPQTEENFLQDYYSTEGFDVLKRKVTLLHCTSEYPSPPASINLKAIETLRVAFKLNVGFSDHSQGIHIPIAAVAMGANVIEKHFTIDKSLSGPDHKASLNPEEFCSMVSQIRDIEKAKGNGRKIPTDSELQTAKIVRKILVASQDINKGDVLTENNITTLRAGKKGIAPAHFWNLLGKKTSVALKKGMPIQNNKFCE